MDLPLRAADHRNRLAEVGLPMPGRMHQRDKHLPPLQPPLPDIGLHDRLAAREAVLGLEPLKDAPRRVPLLARPRPVLLQDPVNDAGEPIQLGPHRWFAAPVARRHRKPQHLRHRLRVDPNPPRRLPLAHPLHMAGTPNPRIQIHSLHPSGLPSATRTKGWAALQFRAAAARLPSRFRAGFSLRRSHTLWADELYANKTPAVRTT